jgi:hypothetical protein
MKCDGSYGNDNNHSNKRLNSKGSTPSPQHKTIEANMSSVQLTSKATTPYQTATWSIPSGQLQSQPF